MRTYYIILVIDESVCVPTTTLVTDCSELAATALIAAVTVQCQQINELPAHVQNHFARFSHDQLNQMHATFLLMLFQYVNLLLV